MQFSPAHLETPPDRKQIAMSQAGPAERQPYSCKAAVRLPRLYSSCKGSGYLQTAESP